jgi:exopolysaccharide biosynthesis protein
MLPAKFPGLATASTLMKRVASKYPNKAAVGVNASGFVSYNFKNGSGFNGFLAKANKSWNYTSVTPIVISDGIVKRDFTSQKMPNSHHNTYVMHNDSKLAFYNFKNGSDVDTNSRMSKKMQQNGALNTFGFYPVLVLANKINNGLSNENNIRQAICQIDKNNFIIYTNISNDRSKGFGLKSLANIMVSDKCVIGFNLDGGGSTNLLYKKKDSKGIIGVRTTSRAVADIIYFYGD